MSPWNPPTSTPQSVGRYDRWYEEHGLAFVDWWDGRFWRDQDFKVCQNQRRPWREVVE